MHQVPNILAAGIGDESQLIILVALAVISVIGAIVKKIRERPQQQTQQPQLPPQARQQPAQAQRPAQASPPHAARAEPTPAPGPQRRPGMAVEQMRRAMAEALGIELEPPPQRPQPSAPRQAAPPAPRHAAAPQRSGAMQRARRQVSPPKPGRAPAEAPHEAVAQHHLRGQLQEQSAASTQPQQAEQLRTAMQAEQLRAAMHAQQTEEFPVAVEVDLLNAQKARRAIICHEVFAQPKCLRQDPDLWDM